jgi:hypothetical protein
MEQPQAVCVEHEAGEQVHQADRVAQMENTWAMGEQRGRLRKRGKEADVREGSDKTSPEMKKLKVKHELMPQGTAEDVEAAQSLGEWFCKSFILRFLGVCTLLPVTH